MGLTLRLVCRADSGGYTMKWRSVNPKPWEFLWRTSVRGPFQPMPTPSLPGRVAIGGRGLSPAEERPSLRPLACKNTQTQIYVMRVVACYSKKKERRKCAKRRRIPAGISNICGTVNPKGFLSAVSCNLGKSNTGNCRNESSNVSFSSSVNENLLYFFYY